MKIPIHTTILAGIAGTVVMTIVTTLAPMMGMPEMNAAEMLSSMMGVPLFMGWGMHFMIGIVFALSYSLLFLRFVRIEDVAMKGAVFGAAVFVFAQIMMATMSAVMGSIASPEGGMALMMFGSLVGHIMYGIPVAFIAQPTGVKQ